MGVRRPWFALLVLLVPASARAGHHKFDVFFSPASYLRAKGSTNNLWGWNVAGAATLAEHHPWLSLIGDFSIHNLGGDGANETTETTQVNFMTGPRFTVKKDHSLEDLYGHVVVFGAIYRTDTKVNGIVASALAIGGGYDIPLRDDDDWGIRVQVDYIYPLSSAVEDGLRISIGAVYKFGFKDCKPCKQEEEEEHEH